MDDKEYSTREMMELLGLKHRPSFRDNYLLPALELGYIEMTIPEKPNSSKQKYRKMNMQLSNYEIFQCFYFSDSNIKPR